MLNDKWSCKNVVLGVDAIQNPLGDEFLSLTPFNYRQFEPG